MAYIDVFNGDADGICALTQLRNAHRVDSTLVTGVKRDIELLDKIEAKAGDQITVLDVSMDKNRGGVERALANGAEIFYVDHHYAGDIPQSPRLKAIINEAPDVCTSILVNGHLQGKFCAWAVVGAFGDNLKNSALALAKSLTLNADELTLLENLGTYINYNGYGENVADLHFTPVDLFKCVSPYANPLDFIRDSRMQFEKLENGYRDDMASAAANKPEVATDKAAVFMLPNQAWARRVSGVYSNDLTNQFPARAHAVLTEKSNGNYLISVRAPLSNKTGADELCRRFPTGGGRAAAAGVNDLPKAELQNFIDQFVAFFSAKG
ncbi:MAG TPA: DHH family phosphoesterase [Spongiibacteraceae bacterium]|nr:DHH family phosphoesterase [Spongiibacteraceae bacterium]